MNEFRNPTDMHAPVAAYSHQAEVREPARWLILSGQIGQTLDGTVPEDPIRQLETTFDNIVCNLRAARMDINDLVKLTIYLVGDFDRQQRQAVITRYLGEHRPCVTMLMVAELCNPIYKVEIEALASQAERELPGE